ncbi:hypothetical protein B0H21DRAFT_819822 [Amylocystis lapponica]|nr:hypothetical protein B0H21DRAFT_819822 [Amylocystis lapponica]
MESSSTRKELDSKKQHDILRQIGTLQLPNPPAVLLTFPASSPKRKQPPPGGLAPASPSPKMKKTAHAASHDATRKQPSHKLYNLSLWFVKSYRSTCDRPPEARERLFAGQQRRSTTERAQAGGDRLALIE